MRTVMLIVLIGIVLSAGAVQAQPRTFIAVATGGTAGVYFPLGAALAEIWSSRVPGVQATAQT
ncbi:MAG: C4-dicarboxylate ABC transporter substrate-binding protein, partial [Armatimonadota bacterium]|nr:C4-dicarboxylate ABC transporter substrate-binding protein [Armatimonadota bacterium]MDR7460364.1 C4-dicarboxylate ABC transporter substrate-binding protein [Armatimonadota bacterium]MDR7492132.1 C4-dicarboxylate ABC transporter substrate-binding protein [Armatimonadota bacterium]MDR7503087.1 C4-dicarboxylate ABC transporter substrate-binding protein [Armatimonadota bacterium]MDR7528808.1 C4-dicarboxylate ABC transporter substrate-binding protein [Armatimonadota bacterium]